MYLFSGLHGLTLSGKITEVWRLLNETALFLQRTAARKNFEAPLAVLRGMLQKSPDNVSVINEVFRHLVELRKQLRTAGYDLSVAKYRLLFDGFRNDDSLAEGFTRLVIFIAEAAFYWKTGDENHLALAVFLERQLEKRKITAILEMHYLWYQRTKTKLILSGAATERPEDFEQLKTAGEADELLFLSRLRGLY
jgi:site-specific recombinase